jgi:hypothetical protein
MELLTKELPESKISPEQWVNLKYGSQIFRLPIIIGSEGEIVLRAIGIPTNMFSVMFAIGRLPGWIAQRLESIADPEWKLNRPRQIYVGSKLQEYLPIEMRP